MTALWFAIALLAATQWLLARTALRLGRADGLQLQALEKAMARLAAPPESGPQDPARPPQSPL